MKTDIQLFKFQDNEFSVIIEDDGNLLFPAKDICKILEYSRTRDALRILDEDEKKKRRICASGQGRLVYFVNVSGLYALILRSRRPEARSFRK